MSKLNSSGNVFGCLGTSIIVVCLIIFSCRIFSKFRAQTQMEKENASSQGCITMDSLISLNYTYLYENDLPCRVFLNSIRIEDIKTSLENEIDDLQNWIGMPTSRTNVGWLVVKNLYFHNYIGFDSIQSEEVLRKAKESETIKAPMVIKVYQVRKFYDNHISYKADLVGFCEDSGVCVFLPQLDSLPQPALDTL